MDPKSRKKARGPESQGQAGGDVGIRLLPQSPQKGVKSLGANQKTGKAGPNILTYASKAKVDCKLCHGTRRVITLYWDDDITWNEEDCPRCGPF